MRLGDGEKKMKTLSMHPAIPADKVSPINLVFSVPFEAQVKAYFEAQGDLRGYNCHGLPGQAVAAILALSVLEMTVGLPTVRIFKPGEGVVGDPLVLDEYRHNVVRPRRVEIPDGETYAGYTILDGAGRGLTPDQEAELQEALGGEIRVVNVSFTPEETADLAEFDWSMIADRLIATSRLTKSDWTSGRVIFLPPGLGFLAAVMAAAVHGLSEAWPRTIRLNRRDDGSFHVDEIVDPQGMRQFGVMLQARWSAADAPVQVPRKLFNRVIGIVGQDAPTVAAELEALIK